MTDQEKIDLIISMLTEDSPVSNTGKILRVFLVNAVPTMPTIQLDRILEAIGAE